MKITTFWLREKTFIIKKTSRFSKKLTLKIWWTKKEIMSFNN